MKQLTYDEFYYYPEYVILDNGDYDLPNPKKGKIYREPNINLFIGEKKVIEVIGMETQPSNIFRYDHSSIIIRLHVRKYKVYIKYESK